MKVIPLPAGIRGMLKAAFKRPRVSGLVGGALAVSAITGLLTLGPAGAETVAAGGTCRPNTAYAAPSALNLRSVPAGLTVVDDGVSTYGVGGAGVAMIRGALERCAPNFTGAERSGEYLAYTSYAVNWSYEVSQVGTACRLSDVTVGLRLRQLLPQLIDRQTTPRAVTDKWIGFITGLREHEDGHKALDIAQARSLLTDLQDLEAPCTAIASRANSLTLDHLATFVSANYDHDTDTDFGRDQGAQW